MTSKIKNILIYSTLGGLLVIGGLYAKRKIYDPRHRVDNAISEVKSLVKENEIQNGDLIFQTSLSGQSKAIQFATKSKYSHCGLIYKEGNEYFVFEAVQPVKMTPLVKWIARGENGHYVIKRLKNSDSVLTPTSLKKMRAAGEQFVGKNYDLTFEWSDDKIYCVLLELKSENYKS
jgi:hypothetical protein